MNTAIANCLLALAITAGVGLWLFEAILFVMSAAWWVRWLDAALGYPFMP